MLGTPNQGSHSITLLLTGRDSFSASWPCWILPFPGRAARTAGQFPGVMELCPGPPAAMISTSATPTWKTFKQADPKGKWPEPPADVLGQSSAVWET
jgi:hypothetical protein